VKHRDARREIAGEDALLRAQLVRVGVARLRERAIDAFTGALGMRIVARRQDALRCVGELEQPHSDRLARFLVSWLRRTVAHEVCTIDALVRREQHRARRWCSVERNTRVAFDARRSELCLIARLRAASQREPNHQRCKL
jgi:hypothetical protein